MESQGGEQAPGRPEGGESKRKGQTIERLTDTALAVADREGVRGVTIRAVAKAAGLSPMSLYTYFGSKNDLYDAMFARVLTIAFERVGHSSWQLELEAGCRQARALLRAHYEWLPLLMRVAAPPASFPIYEHLLELAAADGISPAETMFAASSVISFTLGAVLLERMMTPEQGLPVPVAQLQRAREELLRQAGGRWPQLAAATSTFDEWSFDAVFDHGLRSLIAGIERRARTARSA